MKELIHFFGGSSTTGNELPNESEGLWMQSITLADGTRKRSFCLACFKEGKPWIGGELCAHLYRAEAVGPKGTLDRPLRSTVDADQK
jgi:hypothetical protein